MLADERQGRGRRGAELFRIEVPTAGDAVNVLVVVPLRLLLRARRRQSLLLALRELRLSLHFSADKHRSAGLRRFFGTFSGRHRLTLPCGFSRLACLVGGVFFTAAAVRFARASARAAEVEAKAFAEKKKSQYDEFVKQAEALAERREQVPIAPAPAQEEPPKGPTTGES